MSVRLAEGNNSACPTPCWQIAWETLSRSGSSALSSAIQVVDQISRWGIAFVEESRSAVNYMHAETIGCCVQPVQEVAEETDEMCQTRFLHPANDPYTLYSQQGAAAVLNKEIEERELQDKVFYGANKLVVGDKMIPKSSEGWFLQQALLKEIAATSNKGQDQKLISFLTANFLGKVAPVQTGKMRQFSVDVDATFQLSDLQSKQGTYHRFAIEEQINCGIDANRSLAIPHESPFLLTDTTEFQHLLPLYFHVIEGEPTAQAIFDAMENYFSTTTLNTLPEGSVRPILLDLTTTYADDIRTDGQTIKEEAFRHKFEEVKDRVSKQILLVVPMLLRKYAQWEGSIEQVLEFIKKNIIAISRVSMPEREVHGIKVLPLLSELKVEQMTRNHHPLIDFIISCGVTIGAVNLRRKIDGLNHRTDVRYGVLAAGNAFARLYNTPEEFLGATFFQRLLTIFHGTEIVEEIGATHLGIDLNMLCMLQIDVAHLPHIRLLGKATVDIIVGLLSKVSEKRWNELHEDPVHCQLIQTALHQIREHLASAELHINDYATFAQNIEFVHAQLTTLLEIIRPYQYAEFETIYCEHLKFNVPEELYGHLRAGLCKTAVNTFAGINVAVRQLTPHPQCVYSKGFYYEQAGLLGEDNQFEKVLLDSDGPLVDLYCGQFSPNIDIATDCDHYERRDVARDIRALLRYQRAASSLTVALDCTIEKCDSDNVRALLDQFKEEISNGILNFIFFESGQKFDMFGMDNYYGSPLYMINDGSAKWQPFHDMLKLKAHQTDVLSLQWFCLSKQFASDSLAQYREIIFNNTREILDSMPKELYGKGWSEQPRPIRVSMATEGMDPCFIDLKVLGDAYTKISHNVMAEFYNKMKKAGVKAHTRSTFGLYHANAGLVPAGHSFDSMTIRFNPGLNPQENQAFVEYFQDLAVQHAVGNPASR